MDRKQKAGYFMIFFSMLMTLALVEAMLAAADIFFVMGFSVFVAVCWIWAINTVRANRLFDKSQFKEGDEVILYIRRGTYKWTDILVQGTIEHVWNDTDNPPNHNFAFNIRAQLEHIMTAPPQTKTGTLFTIQNDQRNAWIMKFDPELFKKLEAEFISKRENLASAEIYLEQSREADKRLMALLPYFFG